MPGKSSKSSLAANTLVDLLKEARERASLSQEQVASLTGYSRGYISLVETGDRLPSESFIRRAIHALPVDSSEVLEIYAAVAKESGRRLSPSGISPKQQTLTITSVQFIPMLRGGASQSLEADAIAFDPGDRAIWGVEEPDQLRQTDGSFRLGGGNRESNDKAAMTAIEGPAALHVGPAGVDVLCVTDHLETSTITDVIEWQVRSYQERLSLCGRLFPAYNSKNQYIFSVYVIEDAHQLPWTFARLRSALSILSGPLLVWSTAQSEHFPVAADEGSDFVGYNEALRLEDQLLNEGVTNRQEEALGLVEFGIPEIVFGVVGWGAITYAAMSPSYAGLELNGVKRSHSDNDVKSLIDLEIELQSLWRLAHAAANGLIAISPSLISYLDVSRWRIGEPAAWESVVDERMRNAAVVTSKIHDKVNGLIALSKAQGVI